LARLLGGASLARPTCQILPPGLPGYRRYCPYTLDPRRNGRWGAPDPGKAKRLVDVSGTAGARINVWVVDDDCCIPASVFRYVAVVLRELGYRTHVRVISRGALNRMSKKPNHKVPLIPITWFGGELGAADFLQTWFACDGAETHGRFCDPRLDRLMRRALLLEATDPRRAAAVWADVDRRVADAGASRPLVTPREVELVSSRVRNYQFHPIWGFLADQVWVR
jgi:peptide/nickel transport system substrate-binding protein